jgi:hypothetical protein
MIIENQRSSWQLRHNLLPALLISSLLGMREYGLWQDPHPIFPSKSRIRGSRRDVGISRISESRFPPPTYATPTGCSASVSPMPLKLRWLPASLASDPSWHDMQVWLSESKPPTLAPERVVLALR